MSSKKFYFSKIIIVILILFCIFTRFFKLNWDSGYSFHPDENNIVSLANSISLPIDNFSFFTKGTFSYGSFTAYLSFWVAHIFHQENYTFIVLFLRSLSALCSVATILVIYYLVKKNWGQKAAYLSTILLIFSPGLIQSAHFGTFESILTFLYVLIFWCCLEINNHFDRKYFLLASIPLAMAASLKINSLILAPVIVFIYFFKSLNKKNFFSKIISIIIFTLICLGLTVLLSPYYLTPSFYSMFNYEKQIVLGTLDVFYTRSFIGSKPFLFDFTHILPYLLSPILSFFFPIALLLSFCHFFKNRNILLLFILFLFVPNALLFTKWSRYLLPVTPYIVILISIFVNKIKPKISKYFIYILVFCQILWGLFFLNIYFQKDTRIVASNWINQNIPNGSYLLSEIGNVINLPINQTYMSYTVNNFDFYNLDLDPSLRTELINSLMKADYIIVPSRRVFANMGHLPNRYPLVFHYYQSLFSGTLGFIQITQFSGLPKIASFSISDEFAEETWSVFDHPTIRIFQKVQNLTIDQYENLLQN